MCIKIEVKDLSFEIDLSEKDIEAEIINLAAVKLYNSLAFSKDYRVIREAIEQKLKDLTDETRKKIDEILNKAL